MQAPSGVEHLQPVSEHDVLNLLVTEDFLGYQLQRLVPNRRADLSHLSVEEVETIGHVVDQLESLTAVQLSELSHMEPGWRHTEPDEVIDYHWAFVAAEQVATPTSRRMAQEVAGRYGIDVGA